MGIQAPGSPREGSIWIVCELRVATERQVAAFEQRVLQARAPFWDRFWTSPPLRPSRATFEVARTAYQANRLAIEDWITRQPEIGSFQVLGSPSS